VRRLVKHPVSRSLGDEAERIMHRAKPAAGKLAKRYNLNDDYFVIIQRCGRHRGAHRTGWTWEIRCRSKPFSAKHEADFFVTPQEAKIAGKKALKELLLSQC
jgi:hypothetical protein